MSESALKAFSMDKSVVRLRSLHDEQNEVSYWLSQPPEKRLQAIEFLRESFHGHAYPAQGLERVLRFIEPA